MLKTFTLAKIEEETLSENQGKMTFHLMDEAGVERTVWGTTELGENGLPQKIMANKKREHPLIQCLFNSQVNETIKVEFTQYNEIFERKSDDLDAPTVNELIQEMQKKPLKIGELIKTCE